IARDRIARGVFEGGIVGTLMSNFGLELAIQEIGVPFVRAKVGDRYVLAELESRGWALGGESSGHIVCLDRTTTGDGTVAALQVLSARVRTGRGLHELRQGVRLFPQKMVNVPTGGRRGLAELPEVRAAVVEAETRLAGKGRVLLRPSGTEPVVRVMVEGE